MILIFILFIIPIVLFTISLFLLLKWENLLKFILLNILLAIIYICIIVYADFIFWEHDEYGLASFYRCLTSILFHSFIIFLFSFYKFFKLKNDEKST
jgi:hypothetical protein